MKRPLPSIREAQAILAAKRTRPPYRAMPSAGRNLAPLIKSLDERFGQGLGGLNARWKEIVGEPLARATEPVKLIKSRSGEGQTLEIRVDGPAAALIQHQSRQIIDKVNLFLGAGAVNRLRVTQGLVKAKPGRTVRRTGRKAPPLDAAREAELEAGLAGASDEKLKKALLRLGRNVLRHPVSH